MDDSVHLRAIFIGASLVLVLTIFAMVMNYYSKAKEEAGKSINMEIETVYQANIESAISDAVKAGAPLEAVQVKNIINYYYESYNVLVNLNNVRLLNQSGFFSLGNVNNNSNNIVAKSTFSDEGYKKINFNMDPNQKYGLIISESDGVTIYNLTGKN